jgi:hypothetical protein
MRSIPHVRPACQRQHAIPYSPRSHPLYPPHRCLELLADSFKGQYDRPVIVRQLLLVTVQLQQQIYFSHFQRLQERFLPPRVSPLAILWHPESLGGLREGVRQNSRLSSWQTTATAYPSSQVLRRSTTWKELDPFPRFVTVTHNASGAHCRHQS